METLGKKLSEWNTSISEWGQDINNDCAQSYENVKKHVTGGGKKPSSDSGPLGPRKCQPGMSQITAVKTTTKIGTNPLASQRDWVGEVTYHIPRSDEAEDILTVAVPPDADIGEQGGTESQVVYVSDNFRLDVQITDYKMGSPVVYYMRVRLLRGEEVFASWIVKKRYSELEQMNSLLIERFGSQAAALVPKFPPKLWSTMLYSNEDTLRERMSQLQKYFNHLVLTPQLVAAREVQEVLNMEVPDVPTMFQVVSFGICTDAKSVYAKCQIGTGTISASATDSSAFQLKKSSASSTFSSTLGADDLSPKPNSRLATTPHTTKTTKHIHHGREKTKVTSKAKVVKRPRRGRPVTHFCVRTRKVVKIGYNSETLSGVKEDLIENTNLPQTFFLVLGEAGSSYELTVETANYRGRNEERTLNIRVVAPSLEDLKLNLENKNNQSAEEENNNSSTTTGEQQSLGNNKKSNKSENQKNKSTSSTTENNSKCFERQLEDLCRDSRGSVHLATLHEEESVILSGDEVASNQSKSSKLEKNALSVIASIDDMASNCQSQLEEEHDVITDGLTTEAVATEVAKLSVKEVYQGFAPPRDLSSNAFICEDDESSEC